MANEIKAKQLGCYISIKLEIGDQECQQDILVDSGAQIALLLPIRLIPPEYKSQLSQKRDLAGISGKKLPVAGTLLLDVTVGGITRETEAVILDESLDMPTGLLGIQFLVDFQVTINCGEKSVQVANQPIPSEFLEIKDSALHNYRKALAAKLDLSKLFCVKLHASARKLKDVTAWVTDQYKYSKKLPPPFLGGEEELILEQSLECIRLLYKSPPETTYVDKGCQTEEYFEILIDTAPERAESPSSATDSDSSLAACSVLTAGSLDDCTDCRASYWEQLIDTKIVRPIVKKRTLLSRLSSAEFRGNFRGDYSTQSESKYFEEISSADLSELNGLSMRVNTEREKASQTQSSNGSQFNAELQGEIKIDLDDIDIPGETTEYMSDVNKHSELSIDEMVNLKRARCSQCSTDDCTIKDSTLDLSIFCVKEDLTVAPRSAQSVNVYIKNMNNQPAHLADNYFMPQQHMKNQPNLLIHDTLCETRFENKNKILLVNISDVPIHTPAHTDLGLAIRLANKAPAPPRHHSVDKTKPEPLTVEQRHAKLAELIDLSHLEETEKEQMMELIKEFHSVFYLAPEDYKLIDDFEYKINLKDMERTYVSQFRLRPEHNVAMQEILDDLLSKGVIDKIDPNTDDFFFNTPVFILSKTSPDGEKSYRLLQDQRKVNTKINLDSINSYFPTVGEQFHYMGGNSIFSCLDIKSAFHHVKLAPESRQITAFTFAGIRYHFNVLSQGNLISPHAWVTFFSQLLKELIDEKKLTLYVDDVLCGSKDFKGQLATLRKLFMLLMSKNLCIAPQKCQLAKTEILYVGYLISAQGITIDPARITPVLRLARPQTKKELKSFLGVIAFYHTLIPEYAQLIGELTPLTCLKTPFIWSEHHQVAWLKLRQSIIEPPILQFIQVNEPVHVFTDASLRHLSGVLTRKVNNQYLPISYFSRKVTLAKRFMTIQTLELLAMVQALRKFRPLITGRVFLYTDSKILCNNYKIHNDPRIARLASELMTFDITFSHILGINNEMADMLSRQTRDYEQVRLIREYQRTNEDAIRALQLQLDMEIYPQPHLDLDFILGHQERDPFVQKAIAALAQDARLLLVYSFSATGLLYLQGKEDECDRLIIPKSLANYFIHLYHTCPAISHPSAERLYNTMKRKYFLANMSRLIAEYTAKCITCQRVKKNPHDKKSPYRSLPIGEKAFDHISTDICLIGRKADNKQGFIGFLTIVDSLTKYVKITGIRTQSAAEIARIIWEFCLEKSTPLTVLSDRGGCYLSSLFKELCKFFGSNLITSSSFWSQGNSRSELNNKKCVQVLRNLVDSHPEADWSDFIIPAQTAMNVTWNASINNTPFYLVHGRDYRFPFESYITEPRAPITNYKDFIVVQQRRFYQALDQAQKAQQKMNDKNRVQYDKKTKEKTFSVGDLVLCYRPTLSAKLANKTHKNKYIGPYRVTRQVFPHVYDITSLVTNNCERVNINRLKPFKGVLIFQEDSGSDSNEENNNAAPQPQVDNDSLSASHSGNVFEDFFDAGAPRALAKKAPLNLRPQERPASSTSSAFESAAADLNISTNESNSDLDFNNLFVNNSLQEELAPSAAADAASEDIDLPLSASESNSTDTASEGETKSQKEIPASIITTRSGRTSRPVKRYSPSLYK